MQDIEQLQRDLEEAFDGFSPDARRVWEEIAKDAERFACGEDVAPGLPSEFEDLPQSERDVLLWTIHLSGELHAVGVAETEGMAALMLRAAGVITRGQEGGVVREDGYASFDEVAPPDAPRSMGRVLDEEDAEE